MTATSATADSAASEVPDLMAETLTTLSDLAATVPGHRAGSKLSPATLTRFIIAGVPTRGGRPIRLEAVKLGSKWLTSKEAWRRFIDAQTTAALPSAATATPPLARPKSAAGKKTASQKAAERLKALGA